MRPLRVALLVVGLVGCAGAPPVRPEVRPDSCGRPAITIEGDCDMVLGYYWDGTQCLGDSGCACTGPECDQVFVTRAECEAAHQACLDGAQHP